MPDVDAAAAASRPRLTPGQLAVLRRMRDEDEELVYERGTAYVGNDRVSRGVTIALIRNMAVRMDPYSEVGKFERYTVNQTGHEILEAAGFPATGADATDAASD